MKKKILSATIGLFFSFFIFLLSLLDAQAAESEINRNMIIRSKVVVERVEVGDHTQMNISAVRITNSDVNGSVKINTMESNVGKIITKDRAIVSVAGFDVSDTVMNDAVKLSLSAKVDSDIRAGKSSTIMIGTFSTGSSNQELVSAYNSYQNSPFTNNQVPEVTKLPDSVHEYISDILGKILKGESVDIEDLMQLSELIDTGVYAYVEIEGGIGLGVSQLKANVDVVGIQLKVSKKLDGTFVAEIAGHIGIVDAEGDALVGAGVSAALKGVKFIEISPDCRYITLSTMGGLEVGLAGRAMVGAALLKGGGEGNISADMTVGYKITMPVDRFAQYMTEKDANVDLPSLFNHNPVLRNIPIIDLSSFLENNFILGNIPVKGLHYAKKYDDVSFYLTVAKGVNANIGIASNVGGYVKVGGEGGMGTGFEFSVAEYNKEYFIM